MDKKELSTNNLKRKIVEEINISPEKKNSFCNIKKEPMGNVDSFIKKTKNSFQVQGEGRIAPMEFIDIKQEGNETDTSLDKIKEVKKEPDTQLDNNTAGSSFSEQIKSSKKIIKILKISPQNLITSKNVMPKPGLIKYALLPPTYKASETEKSEVKVERKGEKTNFKEDVEAEEIKLEIEIEKQRNTKSADTEKRWFVGSEKHQQIKNTIFRKIQPTITESEPTYNVQEDRAIFALSNFLTSEDDGPNFSHLKEIQLGDIKVAKIISDHLVGRSERSIRDRLENVINKNMFLYIRPKFLFETVLEVKDENGTTFLVKMITMFMQNHMIFLKCKNGPSCSGHHPYNSIKIPYDPSSKSGIDEALLYNFLVKNAPEYLKVPKELEDFKSLMKKSGVYLHPNSRSHILNPLCLGKNEDKLFSLDVGIIASSQNEDTVATKKETSDDELVMNPTQVETFVRIVRSVGKDRCWKTICELLCLSYSTAFDPSNVETMDKLKQYYFNKVDPDPPIGEFTHEEDKQMVILYSCLRNSKMVARHFPGRTKSQVEKRATLLEHKNGISSLNEYYKKFSACFSLMIIPKNNHKKHKKNNSLKCRDAVQAMTELSLNCLVVGTTSEIFLHPCKETAQFCDHSEFTQKSFIFDSEKSDEQFTNYLKLTMCNELKKVGLVEKSFSDTNLYYRGEGIHALMEKHEKYKFYATPEMFRQVYLRHDIPYHERQISDTRMLVSHLMNANKSTSKREENVFSCEVCGQLFQRRQGYYRHVDSEPCKSQKKKLWNSGKKNYVQVQSKTGPYIQIEAETGQYHPFTHSEEKQLVMLFRSLGSFERVAHHMPGRTESHLQQRATALGYQNSSLCLWNEYYKVAMLCFSLRVDLKNKPHDQSLHSLVLGTRSEIFLYLCKGKDECLDHSKLPKKVVTFDPDKSHALNCSNCTSCKLFIEYLKTTVHMELLKKGLVTQQTSKQTLNLKYMGDGIHALIKRNSVRSGGLGGEQTSNLFERVVVQKEMEIKKEENVIEEMEGIEVKQEDHVIEELEEIEIKQEKEEHLTENIKEVEVKQEEILICPL